MNRIERIVAAIRGHRKTAVAVATATLLAPLLWGWISWAVPAGNGSRTQLVTFRPGTPLKKMADELAALHLIRNAHVFTLGARIQGGTAKAQAGTYEVSDAMPPREILRKLLTGDIYMRAFAVPEGYSMYEIAELLERRKLFSREAFLAACTDRKLLQELGIDASSVEGYLHPSTYNILPGMDERATVRMMVEQFRKTTGRRLADRVAASGLGWRKVLVLASMIEKEATVPAERALISSVFSNRIARGMRLQSDPTCAYGTRAFAGKITHADVARASAYNTYVIPGLPPGPIGNPSEEAVEAALAPARTDFLYFVAKQDGSHYFSRTLEEHNRAVRLYLKNS